MLSIRYGTTEETVTNVDSYFDNNYEEEWFEDPLVKEMVLDIDKSEVLSAHCIQSPVLGQIPVRDLSSGVKALILSLETDAEVWATVCGDNCARWFLEIAKQKDLTISITHYFRFPEKRFVFRDAITGEVQEDYLAYMIKYYCVDEANERVKM